MAVAGARGERLETDVPQKKQTAATDSMEGISPLRDDGRARAGRAEAMLTRSRTQTYRVRAAEDGELERGMRRR